MDKRWIIPSIGKLEILYLERQMAEQEKQVNEELNSDALPMLHPNHKFESSHGSSVHSLATDIDIKQYCRTIDLPGFEDNVSASKRIIKYNCKEDR